MDSLKTIIIFCICIIAFSLPVLSQTIVSDTIEIQHSIIQDANNQSISIESFNDSLGTGKYNVSLKIIDGVKILTLELKYPDRNSLIGRQLPLINFTDIKGKSGKIGDGSWSVLCLWEMYCAPCIKELIVIDALANDFKGFNFFALTPNNISELNSFFRKRDLIWDNISIYPEFIDEYELNIHAYPATLILDENNIIREVFYGDSIMEMLVYLNNKSNK